MSLQTAGGPQPICQPPRAWLSSPELTDLRTQPDSKATGESSDCLAFISTFPGTLSLGRERTATDKGEEQGGLNPEQLLWQATQRRAGTGTERQPYSLSDKCVIHVHRCVHGSMPVSAWLVQAHMWNSVHTHACVPRFECK